MGRLFRRAGYVVYLIEQPMRGRSAWHPGDGATRMFTAQELERLFTGISARGNWPQAKMHSQWPGAASRAIRYSMRSMRRRLKRLSPPRDRTCNQAAGIALLDMIGPAILLTHSQAGYFSWLITDKRPALIKANIAIEPAGPPIENVIFCHRQGRAWGLTNIPISYDPPLTDPKTLRSSKRIMPHRPINPLLVAKGTGTSASESQRDSDTRGRWGGPPITRYSTTAP